MSEFSVRRVVTGVDAGGAEVFTHDGTAPNTIDAGPVGVSEVFWTDGSGLHVGDDPDRTTPGFPLEPPAEGISVRVIRMPGIPPGTEADETWLRIDGDDPDVPGMHATDTLDLMVVLEGSVVLGLDDGEHTLGTGEYVIQRGTRHRWRPADHQGWTYLVAMLRPTADRAEGVTPDGITAAAAGPSPVRRVVTGTVTLDGGAVTAVGGDLSTLTDVWHTGGPLRAVDQGGDIDGPWSLVPAAGGVSFRLVELSPDMPLVDELWHATPTVDVDVIVAGRVRLDLPDGVATELGAGDVVVQRGTNHRWVALGDEPLRMATVMMAADT
jgi:quercetin dioxygenase-like cupin family protein